MLDSYVTTDLGDVNDYVEPADRGRFAQIRATVARDALEGIARVHFVDRGRAHEIRDYYVTREGRMRGQKVTAEEGQRRVAQAKAAGWTHIPPSYYGWLPTTNAWERPGA